MQSQTTSGGPLKGIRFIGLSVLVFLIAISFISCNEGSSSTDRSKDVRQPYGVAGRDFSEGEIIVKFRRGIPFVDMMKTHLRVNARVKKTYKYFPEIYVARLPEGMSIEDALREYLRDPDVEYAEPNYIRRPFIVPDDPLFSQQWGLNKIDAPEAWEIINDASSVVVAVIDTGVDYAHEDLSYNMWVNPKEVAGNDLDDDGNGYVDDIYGINAINGTGDPMDHHGHGTHVSGIIGATGNNGIGVTGVNWKIKIMALKFMDGSGGALSDEIECIDYIIDMKQRGENIKGVNGSFGSSQFSQAEYHAIRLLQDYGIIFVAAAGNEGSNNDSNPVYPASYDLPNIIAVAATDQDDTLADFSNYGIRSVDLGAPGVNILSTIPRNGYASFDGTSMATPHVTGAVGLLSVYLTSYNYIQIKETILSSVEPLPPLSSRLLSGGRLNLFYALSFPGRPVRPTGLSASSGTQAVVNLSWIDNSQIEDGFRIERKTSSTPFIPIGDPLSANTVSYTDSDVEELVEYTYRVYAFNGNGNSPYSNESKVRTPLNAPSGLTAIPVSPSVISLSWTDNSSIEGGFRIERKKGTDPYATVATVSSNIKSYADTGLSSSTTYYYRVRAYKGISVSAYSNEASATTPASGGGGGGGGCSVGGKGAKRGGAILYLLIPLIPVLIKWIERSIRKEAL